MPEHEATEYYKALVDKEFTGKFNGHFHREDENSCNWRKIKMTETSDSMQEGLKSIKKKFEGRIWKGFHNGTLYVHSDSSDEELKRSTKFKIVEYKSFKFDKTWKEPEQYTDRHGFNFIVDAA